MYMLAFPEVAIISAALLLVSFEIAIIVAIIRNKELSLTSKIIWLAVIAIFHTFAAIYYYFSEHSGAFAIRKPKTV